MGKEVKVKSKGKSKNNFYLIIYHTIRDVNSGKLNIGSIMPYICNRYDIDKQNLYFYSNTLKKLKVIDRVDNKNVYLGWKCLKTLTDAELMNLVKGKSKRGKSKSSIGTSQRPITNLHAIHIKMPILSGKIDDKLWEVKETLKNWIPKYMQLEQLGGLTIKNNNNKSISVFVKSRDIVNVDDIHILTHKVIFYMGSFFKNKYDVYLDLINAEVKNLDIATEDKHAESMRGKGEKFTLNLNKKCEKVLPNDDRDAKALIDGTPFKFSAETNDLDWKREYLNMPFNIRCLMFSLPALEEYNKNIKLHIEVMQEIRDYVKELREEKRK